MPTSAACPSRELVNRNHTRNLDFWCSFDSEVRKKWDLRGALLPVVYQNLIAGIGQLWTILLQAGQYGQVVLIHDGTTIFLNIVSTGLLLFGRATTLLLLRLLGDGPSGDRQRQQGYYQEKVTHRVPLF